MAQKGGKFDASGQPIASLRLVTDTDADTGIGSLQDPLRVDPTGTTVQPVSITGSISVTGGLTDTQLRASPVPVSAASLPLPTGAALDATLTGGTQKTKIVDSAGTNLATVSAAGAVKVDGSAVTQPVSAASLPLPTGAALDATLTGGTQKTKIVDTGGTNVASVSAAGAVKVDGSAVTQPISAASLPLPTGAALDATLTGGTAKARVTGNAGATLDSTVGAGTAPTNQVVTGSVYNSAAPAPTTGQALARQADAAGNVRVNPFGNVGSFVSKVVTGAAGNDPILTVPAGKRWILKSAEVTLTTSATVANRQMILGALDPTNIIAVGVNSFTQAASLGWSYCFAPNLTNLAAVVALNSTAGFPELYLGPGFTVRTFVSALQAADVVKLVLNVMEISD